MIICAAAFAPNGFSSLYSNMFGGLPPAQHLVITSGLMWPLSSRVCYIQRNSKGFITHREIWALISTQTYRSLEYLIVFLTCSWICYEHNLIQRGRFFNKPPVRERVVYPVRPLEDDTVDADSPSFVARRYYLHEGRYLVPGEQEIKWHVWSAVHQ
ncbi:hypothetical protein FRC08_012758 [Ceratobasidium sp. 394]|nr:hypothetical protein FRC08_012758 [Ceratobasidium sp. 394]